MDFARARGVSMAGNAKPTGVAFAIGRDRHFEAALAPAGPEIGAAGRDRTNEVGLAGATFGGVIAQGAGVAQSKRRDEPSRSGQG
jgi:hypothetical protein